MASNTTRLGLLKKDPATDGADTFNIKTMLNDNWDALDAKVATLGEDGKVPANQLSIEAPVDASTTQKGVVQLNDNTNSTSVVQAATANAVRKVAVDVGDKSLLDTVEKTSIVEAINEVFQSGNNVKSDMVAALLAVDPALPITTDSTWADIELAVAVVDTGMKYDSGTVTSSSGTSSFQYVSGSYFSMASVTISGLDFKPNKIVLKFREAFQEVVTLYDEVDGGLYPKAAKTSVYRTGAETSTSRNFKGDASPASVQYGGFTLPVQAASVTYTWSAVGF